jgi:hypothetical protein
MLQLSALLAVVAYGGSIPRRAFRRSTTISNMSGPNGHGNLISLKIRSLLTTLTIEPSDYDRIAPKIEYWIEYVLRAHFTTADELVEGVSCMAWEDGDSYASVARFFREFHDAPHRSEQARTFVTQLSSYVLRWFAIASVESLSMTRSNTQIANGGGIGFTRAASFVGHLIDHGLLGQELVRQHLIKPLVNHYYYASQKHNWEPARVNAIYQLFIAAGDALLQGLLEAEDVRLCFETLDAQGENIVGCDAARVKVWWVAHAQAS